MKSPSPVTVAVLILCIFVASVWAELEFPKGSMVRLTKEAPLLFKDKEARTGKAGETFTVVQHNTATKRVYVLATDGDGKQVALNVAEDAVEFAPYDVSRLRAALYPLCDAQKPDFASAAKIVGQAALEAPGEPRVQEYRSAVLAAKAAKDKVAAVVQHDEAAKQRVAQLSKEAWAARNNIADPQGGFARSQQMKAEAEQLIADVKAESEQAKTEWEAAKKSLAEVLRQPVAESPPQIPAMRGLAATSPKANTPPAEVDALPPVAPTSSAATHPARLTPATEHEGARKDPQTDDTRVVPEAPGKLPSAFDKLPEAIAVAAAGARFEEGASYRFIGPVTQMTEEFVMVENLATKQPLGVLVFGDQRKVGNVSVTAGTMIQAIIRFDSFKDIPLLNGATQRMPVFDCIGFRPLGGEFIDTSIAVNSNAFPRLGESLEQVEQRYGKPIRSDSVGAFTRNNYQIKGYRVILAFSENKVVVAVIGKPGMTRDDAIEIMKTLNGGDVIMPEEPGAHHILSSDKSDLEVDWTWRIDNPGFKRSAIYSPREGVLVFIENAQVFIDFWRNAASEH